MCTNARLARKMSLVCVALGAGTVNGHLAIRIGQELRLLPGKPSTRLPFVDSYFPYDVQPSPLFEITWCLQYVAAVLATVAYSGIYCLFVGLTLHLCGQLANLRGRVEDAVAGVEDSLKFRARLVEVVERHGVLIRSMALFWCFFSI